MKKYLTLCLGTLYLVPSTPLFSQDIHFSQYGYSPLTLNPALTAAYKDIEATLQYRDQWHSLNAYRTSAATFEMKVRQFNWERMERLTGFFKKKLAKGLALGVNVFSDRAGDGAMQHTQANFSVSYHALLDAHSTLSAGLMGGVSQRSIKPDALRFNNQYMNGAFDPGMMSGENFSQQSFIYGDYAAGLLYSFGDGSRYITANDQKHFNAGISVSHFSRPKQSFLSTEAEQLHWKWTAHIGSLFGIPNSNYSIGPSLLYMHQGSLNELTFGGLIKYMLRDDSKYTGYVKGAAFSLGCYYRKKDALIPYFLLEMGTYSLGLSYDVNISGLTAGTSGRGGFEIALRFNLPSPFLYQNRPRI
ncbi:MAG TPA: PorP/SprF family type IX secretion system membrane protein [Bacteroidia bacterium]|jgi:type IX secretion system PorP/SprF family membrane protein